MQGRDYFCLSNVMVLRVPNALKGIGKFFVLLERMWLGRAFVKDIVIEYLRI